MNNVTNWLLDGPAWIEYRTRIDLLEQPEDDPEAADAKKAMLEDSRVQGLIEELKSWPGKPSVGVSNASHPLNKLVFLADIGLTVDNPSIREITEKVMSHQSPEGAFQIPTRGYGDGWEWKTCDFPSLVYALMKMGITDDPRIRKGIDCLTGYSYKQGWPCVMSRDIAWYSEPGPYEEPCPIVNVIGLKALALLPELENSQAASDGANTLLDLWEHKNSRRPNMFGIGKRFQLLKAPFVWYDILHTLEVLTQFPEIRGDKRLKEMVDAVAVKSDGRGLFTVEQAAPGWEEWEFGQEREPSRWLTFLVHRIFKRIGQNFNR